MHIPKCAGTSMRQMINRNCETKLGLFKHTEARFLREHIEDFDNVVKFCIIRNPWDRMHSYYHYLKQYMPALIKDKHTKPQDHLDWHQKMYDEAMQMTFSEWVMNNTLIHHIEYDHNPTPVRTSEKSQFDYITDFDGTLLTENIIQFEHFTDQIYPFLEKHNIPTNDGRYHVKQTVRDNYRLECNQEARDHIAKYFEQDIDYFEYNY